MIMETTVVEDSEDQEILKALKNSQIFYDLGKATLMEVGRLWKPSMPEITVYRRKTGTWSIRKQSFVKEKPKA